jgi:homoserine kinase type II
MSITFDKEILFEVTKLWDLELKRLHPEIPISGSPERSEFRIVIESNKQNLFILERVPASAVIRKKYVARHLDLLESSGLELVIPYRKNRYGEQVLPHDGKFWQIQDFLSGIALDRPSYAFEGWRGKVLADFLAQLRRCSADWHEQKQQPFDLRSYIDRFMRDVDRHDRQHLERIQPAFHHIRRKFLNVYDDLPTAFCHGDYHPLNVIWAPFGIGTVIDWEFCGYKTAMYDAANMVGCLGIEDPDALSEDCVCTFIDGLQKSGIYEKKSWGYFYDLIIAIRFGWMAEWLRKKDLEMVEMECDYWDLLLTHRKPLMKIWRV